jgi:hypothetical protein
MHTRFLGYVGAIALIGILAACTPDSTPPDSGSGAVTESQEGRSAYGEIPLPPEDLRSGANPEQIALDAFGMEDPGEGNFSQEVAVVEQTSAMAILTLTQTGLLDDSVEGMRYRLEFTTGEENAWEMVWVGRQVRCYPDRGSQDWSTELCS